jgi:hypothetical protein
MTKKLDSGGGTSSHSSPSPPEVVRCPIPAMSDPDSDTAVLPGHRGRAARGGAARRHPASPPRPAPTAGAGLLPAGGAGAALVRRWHPAGPAGHRQPDRPLDGLPLSARGHRRPCHGRTGVARCPAGRPRRWPCACDGGRHAGPHRSVLGGRPDGAHRPPGSAGGPVVVGQARHPRWQRPGHRRPGRLAVVDLGRAAGPRA